MVLDPEGNPAQLEPYLGMGGHAVVVKNDAKVYIHLHPTGTFSAASAQLIENRIEKKLGIPLNLMLNILKTALMRLLIG